VLGGGRCRVGRGRGLTMAGEGSKVTRGILFSRSSVLLAVSNDPIDRPDTHVGVSPFRFDS
jgi:hypothetical protein